MEISDGFDIRVGPIRLLLVSVIIYYILYRVKKYFLLKTHSKFNFKPQSAKTQTDNIVINEMGC